MDVFKERNLESMTQILVIANLLTHEKAIFYQNAASNAGLGILQYLVENNICCPKIIASFTAQHFGLSFIDLNSIDIASIPTLFVNETLIRRHRIVPLFNKDNQLHVATDDPSQHTALKDIQFHTGLHIVPHVVETHKLTALINTLLNNKENQGLTDYVSASTSTESMLFDTGAHADKSDVSFFDEPVVKFVKRMILDAIEQKASDIHFEPYDDTYRIRYRKDGLLIAIATPPHTLSNRIAARIKVLANLDTSERRVPQDGRFRMQPLDKHVIDFRVSTCPTVSGEKIVVRILDTQANKPDIESLGFSSKQKNCFLQAISRPQGLVLVTGPTGSGKTMTLYAALGLLNTAEKNISTAEDPVEINVHGINQVNINPKIGLTFAGTLRAFLRQDPDIIMIGEMRDLETAEIAIKAAQTGHLVLSTLHTNSAAETLTRLMNMGVHAFNIASSVSLIVAQRLVRRLCERCKLMRTDLTTQNLIKLGLTDHFPSYKAMSCNQCAHGYRGRIALFEVMPISKKISYCDYTAC